MQSKEWLCSGDRSRGKIGHSESLNTGDFCTHPGCGLPRPSVGIISTANGEKTEDAVSKDKALLATLTVLNICSGCTTMVGAAQIFPGFVGYMSGGIIQLILFLLLSGSAAKHAPVRKWLTISIFSFISVYTSFFAYYDQLTAKDQKEKDFDNAIVAAQDIRSQVLAPLEKKVLELEGEISQLNVTLQREINKTGTRNRRTGRKISTQIEQKEIELAKLKPNVEKFQSNFTSPKSDATPKDIFQENIKALASVPNEYRPSKYQGDLDKLRSQFINEDTSIPLLAPYHKVMQREPSAIAAMLIAIGVDGLIIVLGTAIEKRKKDQRYVEVNVHLKGKASDFLPTFYSAINSTTGLISYEELINHQEKEGFRILIDTMKSNALKWIEVRSDNDTHTYYISQKSQDKFIQWYQQARQSQSEREIRKSPEENSSQTVKFILPC